MCNVRSLPLLMLSWVLTRAGCMPQGPADADGTYRTLAIENGKNECMFPGWLEGAPPGADSVSLVLSQEPKDRSKVTGSIGGLVMKAGFDNTDRFSGTVKNDAVEMKPEGSPAPETVGACTFARTVLFQADVGPADYFTGTVQYRYETNQHADCGYRISCLNVQNFTAKRAR